MVKVREAMSTKRGSYMPGGSVSFMDPQAEFKGTLKDISQYQRSPLN